MSEHFDLCVIGSGSGLAVMPPEITKHWRCALVDAGIGEQRLFGGTCLNAGCIPSKMLSLPASVSLTPADAARMNVRLTSRGIDFSGLRARTLQRTDSISTNGLDWQLGRENVKVYRHSARFIDAHTLRVGDETISADRFVLAAGSHPRMLDAPGFDEPDLAAFVHSSDSIMRIPQPPARLIILGGGTEAVEFAHIFSALGTEVTMVNRSSRILKKIEPALADFVTERIARRVALRTNQSVIGLDAADDGGVVVLTKDPSGIEYSYQADLVLTVMGRIPNGRALDVEKAGVALDDEGFVKVDDLQRTSANHIWAIGDICNHQMLKHLANVQARTVLAAEKAEISGSELTLDSRPGPRDQSIVPLGIFISPEVASIGLTTPQAAKIGEPFAVYQQEYAATAWGWAMNDDGHFIRLLGRPDGTILGAHIVGPQATTLLQPIIMGITNGLSAKEIADRQFWVHPAPPEVVENALLGLADKCAELA